MSLATPTGHAVMHSGISGAMPPNRMPRPRDPNYVSFDNDDRKLFVGGLGHFITEDQIREYFCNFGQLEQVAIKHDPITKNSRGFGFVVFTDCDAVARVLVKQGDHMINGKKIDPKRAQAKPRPKKVFIGGLDYNLPEEEIRSFIEQFGEVEDYEFPRDRVKNQRKGFCFVTFKDAESAVRFTDEPKRTIGSRQCDVKFFVPNYKQEMVMPPGTFVANGARGNFMGRGPTGAQPRTPNSFSARRPGGWGMGPYGHTWNQHSPAGSHLSNYYNHQQPQQQQQQQHQGYNQSVGNTHFAAGGNYDYQTQQQQQQQQQQQPQQPYSGYGGNYDQSPGSRSQNVADYSAADWPNIPAMSK